MRGCQRKRTVMRCLADFVLDSDLCLPPDAAHLSVTDPNGSPRLILSNSEHDPALPKSVLSAQLFFETTTFDTSVRQLAETKMSECLNFLSFTTNRKFTVVL